MLGKGEYWSSSVVGEGESWSSSLLGEGEYWSSFVLWEGELELVCAGGGRVLELVRGVQPKS